ncbi:MAG: hypothetical protein QOI41_7270 [Myxococcales bacterium]|nr:hypothetical protein [Myxococcales bacterium]
MTYRESSPPEPAPSLPVDVFEKTRGAWGFPSFARDFPNDPELASLVAAFAAGDYATVRAGAPELASKTTDEHVKRAAELLRARIEPDPTARVFFALTAALLVFLMAWWVTHDGKQHRGTTNTSPAKAPATVEIVK